MSYEFRDRPVLSGKRVVITRAESQSGDFGQMIRDTGGTPIFFPTIEIKPIADNPELDSVLQHLEEYDWVVFTSANGVRLVLDRMEKLGVPVSALNKYKVAVIGPGTEIYLRERHIHVDALPDQYIAEALFDTLLIRNGVAGKRYLLLRADIARPTLREQLLKFGATVAEVPVYHTVPGKPDPEAYAALRAGVDVITFTSSSTVKHFFEMLGDEAKSIAQKATIACIGPVTANTAGEMGLKVGIVADTHDIKGLMRALERLWRQTQ